MTATGAMLMPAMFALSRHKSSVATSQKSALNSFVSQPEAHRAKFLRVVLTGSKDHLFKTNYDISSVFAAVFPNKILW